MNAETPAVPAGFDLTQSLTKIAADPEQVAHLHRVLGTFCHESRNILNGLRMSFYLAKKGADPTCPDACSAMEGEYEAIEMFVERLHSVCRHIRLTTVSLPIELLIQERAPGWADALKSTGRRLQLVPPAEPLVARFDPSRLGSVFDELVRWRAHRGEPGSTLAVAWRKSECSRFLSMEWSEDLESSVNGGGEAIRRPAPPAAEGPATLIQPLVARAAALHGGTVDTGHGLPGPWKLTVNLPLDARGTP